MKIDYQSLSIERTKQLTLISLPQAYRVLSSAELNGGLVSHANHLLNLKVGHCPYENSLCHPSPQDTLQHVASNTLSLQNTTVGMMTAASMNSLRVLSQTIEAVTVTVALTCGLANARRAGDAADYPHLFEENLPQGTINIFVMIDTPLQDKTMVEALSIITEAKAATLQSLNIKSPVSQKIATGTGTDSTAICCAPQGNIIPYCGKHTRLGETLAHLVSNALNASIQRLPLGTLETLQAHQTPSRKPKT
ncbi:MAG: adenosylcobinamide amidohydrolase [Thiomicrorhabdus sp.]|nr:adenosylcobinamide amidohydrolase [Thiomicrorhabdus sp.]